MKNYFLLILFMCISFFSCKKTEITPEKNTSNYINYYDTVGTGKSFVDVYITNTNGSTKIYINSQKKIDVNGSYSFACNLNNLDTLYVELTTDSIDYKQISIRKNYTPIKIGANSAYDDSCALVSNSILLTRKFICN